MVPTHDTEFRKSPVVAGAFTLGTTVHDVPFHCSMRVPPPVPEFSRPTATQKVEVVHETSFSWFEPDPAAALEFVQFVAATVGGLVMVLAPAVAGAEAKGAAKSAISVPAAATSEHPESRHDRPLVLLWLARQSRSRGSVPSRDIQATAVTTSSQLSSSSGPPPPARNSTSWKPAASSQTTHSGGVGNRTK